MQAVILAAGEGKRIRPLTKSRPKALIPVANRPIIEYPIMALHQAGVRDIIVVVGYRKEQVIRLLNELDPSIRVVVQEKQLGTANALKCAEPFIKGDFLLLPGDNYIDPSSITRIIGEKNVMLVKDHPSPSNFGVVRIHDGFVIDIQEKPEQSSSFTISTGVFSLGKEIFGFIRTNDLPDSIACMIENGVRVRATYADDWQNALNPWDLIPMNRRLLGRVKPEKNGTISNNSTILGNVQIGKGTTIGPYTVISGPVVIGNDCDIGPHCCIMPDTSIGARANIEPFTFIRDSLIMDDVSIGSHSRVTDSVIGEGTHLADHTGIGRCMSVLDVDGTLVKSGFGTIIGDRVDSAACTTITGSVIGNGVTISSGNKVISGATIPDDTMVM